MTPVTDRYTWPVPDPADTARALASISGDIRCGLPPKLDDALIVLAAVRAADTASDPGQPIPFTLTAKSARRAGRGRHRARPRRMGL